MSRVFRAPAGGWTVRSLFDAIAEGDEREWRGDHRLFGGSGEVERPVTGATKVFGGANVTCVLNYGCRREAIANAFSASPIHISAPRPRSGTSCARRGPGRPRRRRAPSPRRWAARRRRRMVSRPRRRRRRATRNAAGPRRVLLVRRRHEDEGCPWVPFCAGAAHCFAPMHAGVRLGQARTTKSVLSQPPDQAQPSCEFGSSERGVP